MYDIIDKLWYNYPRSVSTFGRCPVCGNNGGRGGGKCSDCLEKDLARLVGKELASDYHIAIKNVRQLEAMMEEREE